MRMMPHLESLPTGDWFVFWCEEGGLEDKVLGSELDTEDTSSQISRHLLLLGLADNPSMYDAGGSVISRLSFSNTEIFHYF